MSDVATCLIAAAGVGAGVVAFICCGAANRWFTQIDKDNAGLPAPVWELEYDLADLYGLPRTGLSLGSNASFWQGKQTFPVL